jgi:heme-degrading monooxygenase HmoA
VVPVKHIVMWKVAGNSEAERGVAAERVKRAFESLRGRIPGLRHLEVGMDQSAVDYACDVVLVTEFDSAQALHDYATHPEHLRVRDEIAGLRIARHQVDYSGAPLFTSTVRSAERLGP